MNTKHVKDDQKDKYDKVLQIKISLNDSIPKVWRRIQVPKNYTFFELYSAIQDSMGWAGGHLHGFYVAQKGTSNPISIKYPLPDDNMFGDMFQSLDEREEKISNYLGKQV